MMKVRSSKEKLWPKLKGCSAKEEFLPHKYKIERRMR
jgi:hypothetical protein